MFNKINRSAILLGLAALVLVGCGATQPQPILSKSAPGISVQAQAIERARTGRTYGSTHMGLTGQQGDVTNGNVVMTIEVPPAPQPQRNEIITVSLSKATVCTVSLGCFPALVGNKTPLGEWKIQHSNILAPGYGGDVLAFHQDVNSKRDVWKSIHRVYTRNPKQQRIERLYGPVQGRTFITDGCVNVMSDVYDKLVDCCSNGKVVVIR